jgi:hypothetical protein
LEGREGGYDDRDSGWWDGLFGFEVRRVLGIVERDGSTVLEHSGRMREVKVERSVMEKRMPLLD